MNVDPLRFDHVRLWAWLFLFSGSGVSAQSPATVRIAGIVTDSAGRAIQFANVRALPDGRRIVASADGRFELEIETSVREIEIRRIGFEPKVLSLDPWPDSVMRMTLAALPARLERVRVEAQLRIQALDLHGFYARQAELEKGINSGFMITPEEIEQRKGARITDFLLGRPTVRVSMVRPPATQGGVRKGLQPQGSGGCRMEIYVDGIRFYRKSSKDVLSRDEWADYFINDQIPVYRRGDGSVSKRGRCAAKVSAAQRSLWRYPDLDQVGDIRA